MKDKIKNFLAVLMWSYTSAPNNFITGLGSVFRLIFWTAILKRFKKAFIGDYFGSLFLYDTRSDGCAAIYTNRYHEYPLDMLIDTYITKNSIVFDVGSNIGCYAVLCAPKASEVYSFEPNPEVVAIQKIHLLLNNYTNVHIHESAVSNTTGSVSFYVQEKNRSLVSSMIKEAASKGKKITVPTTTVDEEVKKANVNKIDLLIIDVEGAEEKVIQGSKQCLEKGIIKTIFWETNLKAKTKDRKNVINELKKLNYTSYGYSTKGKRITFRTWKPGDANCLSVHSSVKNDLKKFLTQ